MITLVFLVGKNSLEKRNKLVIKNKEFLMFVNNLKASTPSLSTFPTFIEFKKNFSSALMFVCSFTHSSKKKKITVSSMYQIPDSELKYTPPLILKTTILNRHYYYSNFLVKEIKMLSCY